MDLSKLKADKVLFLGIKPHKKAPGYFSVKVVFQQGARTFEAIYPKISLREMSHFETTETNGFFSRTDLSINIDIQVLAEQGFLFTIKDVTRPVKMTLKDIERKLGYPVEIVD